MIELNASVGYTVDEITCDLIGPDQRTVRRWMKKRWRHEDTINALPRSYRFIELSFALRNRSSSLRTIKTVLGFTCARKTN